MTLVSPPQAIALVALGGSIGATGRYLLGKAAFALVGGAFPWGTLAANVLGGLLMGILTEVLALRGGSEALRLFLAVGVLGGFTTFSSYSLEVVLMLEKGQLSTAALYAAGSVLASVLALFCGLWLMRTVLA
ncbi:fluoride efflux transporter CrcB [Pedomonas mirosovicensis]|uniref:fluoride efflux transporter CrcB n=1 Tax=Pedomonas mirosovicensis TaxID=2908641 RepID=UPI002168BCA3|nr:fluoride efflux transporter CrcB [Pedomonas mirosovicensis]MCH8685991.1 fluoride efflux transporter CrcB [Pedomonas mirosovicensis]